MNDQNRSDAATAGATPARESQREEGGQPQFDQQRANSQSQGGRRGLRRRHGGGGGREGQQSSQSARTEASVNLDELRELFDLVASQGFTEFELEKEGFRIRLRRDHSQQRRSTDGLFSAGQSSAPQPIHSTQFTTAPPVAPAQSAGETAASRVQEDSLKKAEAAALDDELSTITSPIVGTFYRSPSPTADPFVRVGSHVDPDSVVCIIEAMKLMNEILAEATGTIEKVYVENGQPVEFGQPLFGIRK